MVKRQVLVSVPMRFAISVDAEGSKVPALNPCRALREGGKMFFLNFGRRSVNLRLEMKDARDLKDMTIHDVEPIRPFQGRSV